ncbi:pilus assembly protein PilN [Oleiphilus sp. HI0071]|jgi:type IV pilus assembly protein PilN|uniref:PilN domain-containing protein n=1 Tax=unclassified Oleiphilus TaxID=2631174 RepID=UPI0007C24833|nr:MULTISPECIES: PilN domain-containing protein [unclassified Oleiphilus]KZY61362.1 pilus assembly protein PilN [Oleiphilus sp. HI0065]KZY87802.1 pilus assembly protein PilN [Oleiphilus sp. HI0071]KZY89280.1 pilus assembly protein PilN [Oleiphilus sp. HI0073]KZZ40978.1 pilus assembly protein PilN [Oleiphilus sp. HI0118]KZZ51221.1 pilus assembly protein PilN [Oleiphilus sp. HI0122]KZZ71367.1 pilus assembly protein PilN [Oleiphilus sp. HI0130]KZZ81410.1 pilus assembly protein PilN [Oleiphilus 
MPSINLRPWREEERAKRQKEFIGMLVAVAIAAGGLFFLWNTQVDAMITEQKARNAYIKTSMAVLDKKTKEIAELKERREQLLARMKVIQDLQGTRPVIVRVFDELVKTLPEDLYYTSLVRKVNNVSIQGIADSNNRISGLMRNLEGSDWFASPNLKDVKAAKGGDKSAFDMAVMQVTPASDEVEGE